MMRTVDYLRLDVLEAAEDNPRRDLGELDGLVDSIAAVGILEPLVVRAIEGDRYEIICGARRFAAAQKAGLDHVPCIVREFDDRQRLEVMLIENLQRDELHPLDEARAYRRLIDEAGMEQKELASRVGRSEGHVAKRLALLRLPPDVQGQVHRAVSAETEVANGTLSIQSALALAKLVEHPDHLARVLDDWRAHPDWYDLRKLVDEAVAQIAVDERRAEAQSEALRRGLGWVEPAENWFAGKVRPVVAPGTEGAPIGALEIDPAAHAREVCHAASADPRTGEFTVVCTDPARHRGIGATASPLIDKDSAEDARERARNKAIERELELASRDRRAHLAGLLLGSDTLEPLLAEDLLRLLDEDARERLDISSPEIAAPLLGIDPDSLDEDAFIEELFARVDAAELAPGVLAAAVALAEVERTLRHSWNWVASNERVSRHVELLRASGYVFADVETELLERSDADEADPEEP